MTIAADIQKLQPGALIKLFEIDATSLGGDVSYFHPGTDASRAAIVWQGNTYNPWPIDASGFEINGKGTLPTPKLQIANIGGVITALCLAYDDMIGAKVTRRRTFARYLDGQPDADPTAGFPDEVFYISRKSNATRPIIEFELASALDVEGTQLPKRQVFGTTCWWQYRSAECGYTGGAVADANDAPVTDLSKDVCGLRITSCKLRFGANNPLPFGGFPGAVTF